MKRRIFASLLALCLLAGLPVKALAAEDADNEQEITAPAENIVQEPEGETSPETCTLTEGCTLPAGHEGECVLDPADTRNEEMIADPAPGEALCTKTAGCTLPDGHEGECVLEPEEEPENGASLDASNVIEVDTADGLAAAIKNASPDAPTTIQINADLRLTREIVTNKEIIQWNAYHHLFFCGWEEDRF